MQTKCLMGILPGEISTRPGTRLLRAGILPIYLSSEETDLLYSTCILKGRKAKLKTQELFFLSIFSGLKFMLAFCKIKITRNALNYLSFQINIVCYLKFRLGGYWIGILRIYCVKRSSECCSGQTQIFIRWKSCHVKKVYIQEFQI